MTTRMLLALTRRTFASALFGFGAGMLAPLRPTHAAMDESRAARRVRDALTTGAIPAMSAIVVSSNRVLDHAWLGVRAYGDPTPIERADRWHIGSCMKAITANIMGKLHDAGTLGLDTPLDRIFPARGRVAGTGYGAMTIGRMLAHNAGVRDSDKVIREAGAIFLRPDPDGRALREQMAGWVVEQKLASKKAGFDYSNANFLLCAAMAERQTGMDFADLMRDLGFAPLGITEFGFGPPGTMGMVDQPRGHTLLNGKLMPVEPGDPGADNVPAMLPAGTLNISLEHWAKFIMDQLAAARGAGQLLSSQTYARLFTPVDGGFALGWGVMTSKAGPRWITHSGTNGKWYSIATLEPESDVAVAITCNGPNSPGTISGLSAVHDGILSDYRNWRSRAY